MTLIDSKDEVPVIKDSQLRSNLDMNTLIWIQKSSHCKRAFYLDFKNFIQRLAFRAV